MAPHPPPPPRAGRGQRVRARRGAIAWTSALGLSLAQPAVAEHGDPYLVVFPGMSEGMPPDGSLLLQSRNGPHDWLETPCRFTYVTTDGRIAARVVSSGRDADAAGYGTSHVWLRATRRLPVGSEVTVVAACDEGEYPVEVQGEPVRRRVVATRGHAPSEVQVDVHASEDEWGVPGVRVTMDCTGPCGVLVSAARSGRQDATFAAASPELPFDVAPDFVRLTGEAGETDATRQVTHLRIVPVDLAGHRGRVQVVRLPAPASDVYVHVVDRRDPTWTQFADVHDVLVACTEAAAPEPAALEPARRLLEVLAVATGENVHRHLLPPLLEAAFDTHAARMATGTGHRSARLEAGRSVHARQVLRWWVSTEGDADCPEVHRQAALYDRHGRLVAARTVVETCELVDPAFTHVSLDYGDDGRSVRLSLAERVHPAHRDPPDDTPLPPHLGLLGRDPTGDGDDEGRCTVTLGQHAIHLACDGSEDVSAGSFARTCPLDPDVPMAPAP